MDNGKYTVDCLGYEKYIPRIAEYVDCTFFFSEFHRKCRLQKTLTLFSGSFKTIFHITFFLRLIRDNQMKHTKFWRRCCTSWQRYIECFQFDVA